MFPVALGQISKIEIPPPGGGNKYLPSFVDAYFAEANKILDSEAEIRISVHCVDFRTIDFVLQKKCDERKPFVSTLKASMQRVDIRSTFMVAMPRVSANPSRFIDQSAAVYVPREEYRRLQLDEDSSGGVWRVSDANRIYSLCETYPSVVVVPGAIPDLVHLRKAMLVRALTAPYRY